MELKRLWLLQETDLAIKKLESDLEEAPAASGVEEARLRLEELRVQRNDQQDRLKEYRKQLRQHEMSVQKIDDERSELKEKLYSGKVTVVKELEQMHRKMDLLAAEKSKLEDMIIDLMETGETLGQELSGTEESIAAGEADLNAREEELAARLEELNRSLGERSKEREKMAANVDKKFLDRYTVLQGKYQGRPLARVVEGTCEGCRVIISSALRGHLYNPDAMVYCENCGRLLLVYDK